MAKSRRTVLVTGASRGLGLGIARKLAGEGHHVIALARQKSKQVTEAMAETKSAKQGALDFVPFDLGKIDDIPNFVKTLRKDFGPLFGLVNNAAIGHDGALAMMHNSRIEELVRVNTLSPVVLTKYVVRAMMAGGGSRVVNIGSIVARTGYSGLAAYSASKAAMEGFTRSLARELGPLGITVNAVAPGFVDTEMTSELNPGQRERIARRSALGRMAEIADIAAAVAFLLSDAARNMTGTVLTVDAGNTA